MSDSTKESLRGNSAQPETDLTGNVATVPIENPRSEVEHPISDPTEINVEDFEPVDIGSDIGGSNVAGTKSKPDRRGEVFDPSIHCQDENGNPKRNKDGTFKKRPLQKPKEIPIPPPPPPPPVDFNDAAPPGTMQMVCMCLDVTCMIMVQTIGEEMRPSPQERQLLTDVYSRYIHYKGWDQELSPEVAVVMVTFMFLSPRIPVIIKKWSQLKKGKQNAHINIGTAGNGQNDNSQDNRPASGSTGKASGDP